MTKYILHGGETSVDNESNHRFFLAMIGNKPHPQILCVYFARSKDEWPAKFEQDKLRFAKIAEPDCTPELVMASDNIDELKSQIISADTIYIRGGSFNSCPKELFEQIPDVKQLLNDKIVAGSSAGANVIAKYYHSLSLSKVGKGTGWLPIKVLSHTNIKTAEQIRELEEFGEQLPVVELNETEFKTIEVV
ncbi:Type 1 glutamine amidotransferase-like domain-containing protein [Patescibacteria group bacterium]